MKTGAGSHGNWALAGISLQAVLGFLFLKIHLFNQIISGLNGFVIAIQESTEAGTSMVFGYLGGGPLPFEESFPGAAYILAFKSLPVILVLSALSSLLFYWRILPLIIGLFSRLFEKTLRIGGAEGLGLAANIFVGMIEAPLLIRPYLKSLNRSELFSIMCCGNGHRRRHGPGTVRRRAVSGGPPMHSVISSSHR